MQPVESKKRVSKAGDSVRQNTASNEDLTIIEKWRAAHRHILNTFQAILRTRTRRSEVIVAQRHKRRTTIFGKLQRFPNMQLARMDDIAGCRLIFSSVVELYEFRNKMHSARFKHVLKNTIDKYDYIKKPKDTGYRGVHDIYAYNANSEPGKIYKGLLIELQYRTNVQHAWATAVEVVGFVTESQPKFKQGDNRYQVAFAYASEILARAFENSNLTHVEMTDEELIKNFLALEKEIGLMRMLKALNSSDNDLRKNKNIILIFEKNHDKKLELDIREFRDATDALKELFKLEKEFPNKDIVLVRADKSDDVRIAFRNYFSDAAEFIRLIDEGCQLLLSQAVAFPKNDFSRFSEKAAN